MTDPEQGELIERQWELHLTLTPTEDGKFARVNIDMRKPTSRLPTYINSVGSTDMLYEKVQGEFNNALRHIVNDIHQQVVKPAKTRR